MRGRIELKKSTNGQFFFHLKAGNFRIILSSELYHEKEKALHGIESVKKNSGSDAHFERRKSHKGEPYFVLKAVNGEIIGTSEMYSTIFAREIGIGSVKTNGPTAQVVDHSE